MPVERFLDTNILLYAYDLDAPEKREIARSLVTHAWLAPGTTAISVQVLQEFHVNFIKAGNPAEESLALISDFSHWPVIENSPALFQLGLKLQSRWQLSLWDAMILAAAQSCGAPELFTEDLNDGQQYGSVRAINPFKIKN